jgi:hypothetical protein
MSGKEESKSAPISLTQDEVDALTKGGKGALSVRRRRFRDDRSAKRSASRPRIEKSSPQAITRREMAAIVKGRVPPSVRKRIVSVSPSTDEKADAHSSSDKAAPTVAFGQQKYLKT